MVRRVDVEQFRQLTASMSEEDFERQHAMEQQRVEEEYAAFEEAYAVGKCYLCGKPFKTISKEKPCVHWLLRQCKFKKKDFPLIYERFGYTQLAAFARWCANQEKAFSRINDLSHEKLGEKVFESTVCWRNIEWTFSCSQNDFDGHGSGHSAYPHYHFQMRIDKRPFIDFSDFHIPLSEEDLFHLDLTKSASDIFHHDFGVGGMGMEAAMSIPAEYIIDETEIVHDEDEATYRLQTIMMSDDGFDGEMLQKMLEESRATGKTMASMAKKYLSDKTTVRTVVMPADAVPEIAHRTERKRR